MSPVPSVPDLVILGTDAGVVDTTDPTNPVA